MAAFFATDYVTRHAELMQSAMSDEEIAHQLSLSWLPKAPAVSSKCASSSSRGYRVTKADRVTKEEEDYLCALGINVKQEKKCASCAESKPRGVFLSTKGCAHEYCTDCCKQHAEREIRVTAASQIECPHPSCRSTFGVSQCQQLLSQANFEALNIRQVEATIPFTERVYCPFPECSAFIPILRPDFSLDCTLMECHSCGRGICLECNVPWEKECNICADAVAHNEFICTKDCSHEYCTECCRHYAEAKLMSGSAQVDCPHPDCAHAFHFSQCTTLLSALNFDILNTRLTEAAIPAALKVFCPYEDCSFLMERSLEESGGGGSSRQGGRSPFAMCFACHRGFCLDCKVPWHGKYQSCEEYRAHAENEKQGGDEKLRDLAKEKNWQVCPNCALVVELKSGCYHITCRCKTEFCYLCQKKWENKKATCKCKLWDERNL